MSKASRILEALTPWHKQKDVESREAITGTEVVRAGVQQRRLETMLKSFKLADVVFEKRKST